MIARLLMWCLFDCSWLECTRKW